MPALVLEFAFLDCYQPSSPLPKLRKPADPRGHSEDPFHLPQDLHPQDPSDLPGMRAKAPDKGFVPSEP